MNEDNIREWLGAVERCEIDLRSMIASGKYSEMEAPLRTLKNLLDDSSYQQEIPMDYYYFTMVYEQCNAALYQNIGKMQPMKEHILLGKVVAGKLEELLPIDINPCIVPERSKMMAINCAQFAKSASLAMESIELKEAWDLLLMASRIYDWLWPDLLEKPAIPAIEIHLKLASFSLIFKDDSAECERQLSITKEKYLELFNRTGNDVYREKAGKVALGAQNGEVSEEMLESNPAIALVYRTAYYTDCGMKAMESGDEQQGLFYYEKAAIEAEHMLEVLQNPNSWKVAAWAFFVASSFLKKISPERAKQWAISGEKMCDLLEQHGVKDCNIKDINYMRKEFAKISGKKKQGFLNRIFGN